jgi:hypothetical protein
LKCFHVWMSNRISHRHTWDSITRNFKIDTFDWSHKISNVSGTCSTLGGERKNIRIFGVRTWKKPNWRPGRVIMKWILHKNGCVISEMTRLHAGYARNGGSIPTEPKVLSFLRSKKSYLFSEASRRDLGATKHWGKRPKVKLAFHPIYCRRQVRLELFLHSPYAFKTCSGTFSPVYSKIGCVTVNGIDLGNDGDEWRVVTTFWIHKML